MNHDMGIHSKFNRCQLVWDLCGGYLKICRIGIVVFAGCWLLVLLVLLVLLLLLLLLLVVVAVVVVVVVAGGGGSGGGAGAAGARGAVVADRADADLSEMYWCTVWHFDCEKPAWPDVLQRAPL